MQEPKQLQQLIQTIDAKIDNLDKLSADKLVEALDDLAQTLKNKPKWIYKEDQIKNMASHALLEFFNEEGIL